MDERTRGYLQRVRQADPIAIAPWRTATCPECGEAPSATDHVHVVMDGAVILGCEGYWVVSPAALGMAPGQWQDWTED